MHLDTGQPSVTRDERLADPSSHLQGHTSLFDLISLIKIDIIGTASQQQ
jgi:hypothetical protein